MDYRFGVLPLSRKSRAGTSPGPFADHFARVCGALAAGGLAVERCLPLWVVRAVRVDVSPFMVHNNTAPPPPACMFPVWQSAHSAPFAPHMLLTMGLRYQHGPCLIYHLYQGTGIQEVCLHVYWSISTMSGYC
jgi:hypothetical protein